MICSDQKAISDWTLNSSTHIKSEADPIYDCVIKPIGFHNDSSIAVRSKRRPTQNEHYYSSTPDDLDDDCPQALLTEEKTKSENTTKNRKQRQTDNLKGSGLAN